MSLAVELFAGFSQALEQLGVQRHAQRPVFFGQAGDQQRGAVLELTDTDHAPWHVIASDNKMRARLKGLKIVEDIVGKGIDDLAQPLDPKIAKAAHELWGWKPGAKKKNKHH